MRRKAVVVTVAVLRAAVALGQASDDVDAGVATPSSTTLPVVSITDAPARVEEIGAILSRIEARSAIPESIARIEARLPSLTTAISHRIAQDRELLTSGGGLIDVDVVVARWNDEVALLRQWDDTLGRRGKDLEALLGELDELLALWNRTRERLRAEDAPAELLARVGETLTKIGATRAQVAPRRDIVITLRNQVAQQRASVSALIADSATLRRQLLGSVLARDQPPLWRLWARHATTPLTDRLGSTLRREQDDLADFVRQDGSNGGTIAFLVLVGLMLATIALARRARRWTEGEVTPERVAPIIQRPVSTGLILWVLVMPWLPDMPMGVRRLATFVLIIPVIRLLGPLLGNSAAPAAAYLVSLLAADRLADLLVIVPELSRPIFLVEMAVGWAAAEWVRRLATSPDLSAPPAARRALASIARAAQGILVVAAGADVLGFGQLARLLGDGTVISGCAGLAIWVTKRAIDGLVSVLVRSWPLSALRLVRRSPQRAARRLRRTAGVLLLALWGASVLRIFRVLDMVVDGIRAVLAVTLEVGELAISIGDVVFFALGVYLAVALSRGLRVVLEEEILSRAVLPRGVPYAISTVSGYAVLLAGIIIAFAAAGIELGRLSIVLGGLGVGIGFGLQEIVRDFVAGSVLLFERPIQIGDVVQMESVFGDVRRIGLRSSTIRTYEGAEIIVPNSTLTSSQIINWTLSDRKRRVDVAVGVAYGTDPARVIALLEETARSHPDLLPQPEPTALFTGFGESSLDFQLRAWTDRSDQFMHVRSNVAVAVHAALAEAGITIPFPQRDLHVRTLPPERP